MSYAQHIDDPITREVIEILIDRIKSLEERIKLIEDREGVED
jgi:hypothetical protein